MSRVWCGLLACSWATLAGAQDLGVQRGVLIQPESVTVGDPFRVVVRLRAPRGTVLEFPESPDTAFKVEPLDKVVVTPGTDSSVVEQTAVYRLAAWDVGRLPLRFPDILATRGDTVQRIGVGRDLAVTVVTVLPADSTERVPKPVRSVYEFGLPWWLWFLVALAALALGALLWWWWRRRNERRPVPVADPYGEALRAFEHIDSLGLPAAGEGGQHVALMTEVVRTYLARVAPVARLSLTSSELVHVCRGVHEVPLVRLQRLLHDADLVKFAGQRAAATRANEFGLECRAIVDAVHQGRQPQPAQAA
jgi:hypothetical protein